MNAEAAALNTLVVSASDPGAVAAALQTVADVNEMSVTAWRVATTAVRAQRKPALPEDVAPFFWSMGELAFKLGHELKRMVSGKDRLHRIRRIEEQMDEQRRRLFAAMTILPWSTAMPGVLDAMRLASHYERFADHAVAIAYRLAPCEGDDVRGST